MARASGSQTRIGTVVPNLSRIKQTVSLSREAKLRLSWIDFYNTHDNAASLTCRHFGIAKSCFHKWLKRFQLHGATGLEAATTRPKHVRQSHVPLAVVDAVRRLRQANPEYSKYKLAVILKRDYGYQLSASTIGRIITKYQLFFTSPVKPKGHPGRRRSVARLRKPRNFIADTPGRLIEVDVKHLSSMGTKRHGFVAIDVVSKQATVHVGATISAAQGALEWRKTSQRYTISPGRIRRKTSRMSNALLAVWSESVFSGVELPLTWQPSSRLLTSGSRNTTATGHTSH